MINNLQPKPTDGQEQEPTGRLVSVYRVAGNPDCTNGGVSANYDTLFDGSLIGKGIKIVSHNGYYMAYPFYKDRPGAFGGNYVHSTDSIWRSKYPHPVPVFDRYGG